MPNSSVAPTMCFVISNDFFMGSFAPPAFTGETHLLYCRRRPDFGSRARSVRARRPSQK